eukprot:349946-Chlamydomonas_euryale.AAC.4
MAAITSAWTVVAVRGPPPACMASSTFTTSSRAAGTASSRAALADNGCLHAICVVCDPHGPCVLIVVALITCDALARSG